MRGAIFDRACLQGIAFRARSTGAMKEEKAGNDSDEVVNPEDADGDKEDADADKDEGVTFADNERPSDLRGSSFRGANIWRSAPATTMSIRFVDFQDAVLAPVGGKEKEALSQLFDNLGFVWVPDIAHQRIGNLLSPTSKKWSVSNGYAWWKSKMLAELRDAGQAKQQRAQFLAQLVCGDVRDGAETANAIASMRWPTPASKFFSAPPSTRFP
jgi:hypothetical protein